MRNLSIIGSTGSIGTQALDVVDVCADVNVVALSANNNVRLLEKQIRKYKPDKACIVNRKMYSDLKTRVSDTSTEIISGEEGLCEIASFEKSEMVLTSLVGNAGLLPTITAIKNGKKILLANKETLVTSGSIIMPLAKEYNVDILPVDSEHSAIFQCLQGNEQNKISKILLTASGGPFFGRTKDDLSNVTISEALNHPNWSMGAKITIDSATMMNKGLEVIEAKWLFNVDISDVEVYIHRQSIIHSMVEFSDNSVIAQLGNPDMKLPIMYALNYPLRSAPIGEKLDLFKINTLTFEKPDTDTFECLDIAIKAGKSGGTTPTVMNASNEIAVERFLSGEIRFTDIALIVKETIRAHKYRENINLNDVIESDKWAREFSRNIII